MYEHPGYCAARDEKLEVADAPNVVYDSVGVCIGLRGLPIIIVMIQSIIIILLFLAAVGYLIRLVYLHFSGDKSCPKGCGACSAVDIDKIKKQLQRERT